MVECERERELFAGVLDGLLLEGGGSVGRVEGFELAATGKMWKSFVVAGGVEN